MNQDPGISLQPLSSIRKFQFQRLKETFDYVNAHAPFYQRLFSGPKQKLKAPDGWDSFHALPTTSKNDIQTNNWDFFCVPRNRIVEYTSTSGTLGKPVTVGLTIGDVKRLAYNEYLSFTCAEGSSNDLYQLMLTLDRQFMAGIAYYEGIRKLGAGLIRVGPGSPAMQLETIERLRPSALVAVPSFLVKLIGFCKQVGFDLNSSGITKAICIGEGIRQPDLVLNALGKKITADWDIKLFSTYASTEMQTAFTECAHGNGCHLSPELIYIEILDDNNNLVESGELGEIVITTFGIEGMPLFRYKTGDQARLFEGECSCGRTSPRLGPIEGRKQHMIKLRGTTLYPPAIFDTMNRFPEIRDYVIEAFPDELDNDGLKIFLLVDEPEQPVILEKLKQVFRSSIRVVPAITFLSSAGLEALQTEGGGRKLTRFLDRRVKAPGAE